MRWKASLIPHMLEAFMTRDRGFQKGAFHHHFGQAIEFI
jgi:hypothetical protein